MWCIQTITQLVGETGWFVVFQKYFIDCLIICVISVLAFLYKHRGLCTFFFPKANRITFKNVSSVTVGRSTMEDGSNVGEEKSKS